MTKRKVTKASKRRLLFFGSISVLVISYFIFNTFAMVSNIKNLSLEQQTLQNNLTDLQNDEINLNKELDKLKNDEYKAKYAREYFLYSKEQGEYIFATILDSKDEDITKTEVNDNEQYHYVIATVIIILLLLILFIIKRIRKNK